MNNAIGDGATANLDKSIDFFHNSKRIKNRT
jgi:hypothetical protein